MSANANRVVIVTGGAQGIGEGIVRRFASHRETVIIADRQMATAEALARTLCDQGHEVIAMPIDLASPAACKALVTSVINAYGKLDVLIHNAGYFPLTPLADISEAILAQTLAVNLAAPFWLSQAAIPCMQAQGKGRILITSSVTGPRVAYPGLTHYAASKAGVNGFIRSAALELAHAGITVNGVEPGMIRTPAMENLGDTEHNAKIEALIPLGRLGMPADIAGAMFFLASDEAAYITGQTIVVDGGATLPESTAAL
ncbi:SDR family oxidoreductase [Leeia sp. TBRC 13508]|uniref:SDR family oxidoreductase n=1 Tax=Leeia speluncae TaxID=2884804 RepID=A0ABS8D4K7_9NEIS|nr:SDR family oxidoreductase [Leeia speluncae]MCB6183057.1 SDR family oxidoreductase [Leeia speluncae]